MDSNKMTNVVHMVDSLEHKQRVYPEYGRYTYLQCGNFMNQLDLGVNTLPNASSLYLKLQQNNH